MMTPERIQEIRMKAWDLCVGRDIVAVVDLFETMLSEEFERELRAACAKQRKEDAKRLDRISRQYKAWGSFVGEYVADECAAAIRA